MILKLLTLWCGCAEKRASGKDKVGALVVHLLVDEEILLLRADCCGNAGNFRLAQKVEHLYCNAAQALH